jgi:molybdopterin-containing oxidoreductase family iron-sulfur binding subunit
VYHLPPQFGYAEALKSVPLTVCLTEAENETAQACTYMLPTHQALESWGDHRVRPGVYSLQQPVVAPLYTTRQTEAVLLQWMAVIIPFNESVYLDYLKKKWETELFPRFGAKVDFPTFWNSALHDGVVVAAEAPPVKGKFRTDAAPAVEPLKSPSGYTLLLTQSPFIGDGSFANNGWLQEIPNPVSKIVWDNYAALSPATARELEVEYGDLIDVTVEGRRQALPVFVQPGMADRLITVALGYGRTNAGPVGTGVGTDVTPLLTRAAYTGSRIISGVSAIKGAGRHELSSTQEHHALDDTFVKELHVKRKIIRELTLEGYLEDPGFLARERRVHESISKEVEYHGVKWGMAIDLNKCTGCNACVAGCNVENNIPVVGKEQVQKGREMQWIRIDRYYSGTPDEPVTSHQPMLCQHCDNAPCENVCPVVATNHSPDGLNQMVYNRCVGTKYCSNNCPYKVRRFNFYNWRDNLAEGYYEQEPVNLLHNPEVTVRSRGVMEKCTFCVQRIMEARQHATEQGVEFSGKDVQTACQQACPARAIEFGNTNDPQSAVAKLREHPLGYHVLEELNVRPNVTYLARLRNIHSEKLA